MGVGSGRDKELLMFGHHVERADTRNEVLVGQKSTPGDEVSIDVVSIHVVVKWTEADVGADNALLFVCLFVCWMRPDPKEKKYEMNVQPKANQN